MEEFFNIDSTYCFHVKGILVTNRTNILSKSYKLVYSNEVRLERDYITLNNYQLTYLYCNYFRNFAT